MRNGEENDRANRPAVAAVVQKVRKRGVPSDFRPFLGDSFDRLMSLVCIYIGDLVAEADKESRRDGVNQILVRHVEHASARLVIRPGRKKWRIFHFAGGLMLGVAIPVLVFKSEGTTGAEASLAAGLGILGAAVAAYSFARE